MKKRGVVSLLFLISINIVLASSFVLASIGLGNQSSFLYTSYSPGESINGWVNLSIVSESTDLKLTDNKGNSITLLEWLKASSSTEDYSCSPISCSPAYAPTGDGSSSMSFDLSAGETRYVGFKFTNPDDAIERIDNFNFTIVSDASSSCENQLEIQLMDDSSLVLKNKNSILTRCPQLKSYGCFNASKTTQTSYISGTSKFCQKVYLYDSPGFYLGTWLKRNAGAKDTKIEIKTLSMDPSAKASCTLPGTSIVGEAEYSCSIDVWNEFTPGEYYVCVSSNSTGDENTFVNFYNDNATGCGFYSSTGGIGVQNKAYQIYAQGKEFAPFGSVDISDRSHTTSSLNDKIKVYLDDMYDGICNPCIVPIKFTAMQSQRVTVTPVKIQYSAGGGYNIEKVHNVSTQGAKVSTSGYKKLSLNNISFYLPTTFGALKYNLNLGTKEIFKNKDLTIEKAPVIKSIYPSETVHSFPVKLTVKVEMANNASITSYVWKIAKLNFTRTTTTNELDYTFPYPGGTYDIEITVTDRNQKTVAKTFTVTTISPGTYVTDKIKIMKANLVNITDTITKMPSFEQSIVKNAINFSYLNSKLQAIEALNVDIEGSATKNYTRIVSEMTALKIPSLVEENAIAISLSFYPKRESINLEALESFHGGSHEASETNEYIDAIVYSYSENINGKITKKEIIALYDSGQETIAGVYELKLTSKGVSLAGQNLIMKEVNGLTFKASYNEERESGYVSIPLDGKEKIIAFSTTENIDYFDLPLFISPPLEELVIVGVIEEAEDQGIKWALFILIIFFLLLAGLAVYIILQYWYKTKYETYLFKERNYLFNLIHYINDSKKKGLPDKEIWKKLRQKGWTREQITYVMRKYVGKRTGMLEIPIDKLLNKIFGSKSDATQQVLSKPGVIMPSSPGQPMGMPPRRPFTGRPMPGQEFNNQPGNPEDKSM